MLLALLCAVLSVWSLTTRQSLKKELDRSEQERAQMARSLEARDLLLQADAEVIVHGNYEQALSALCDLRSDDPALAGTVQQRVRALQDMIGDGSADAPSTDPQELLIGRYQRTIAELRAEQDDLLTRTQLVRDSMQLRMEELRIELERKQRELGRKEQVQVLAFTSAKGQKIHYLGEVRDGKANGGGVGIWTTGSVYRGQWRNNLRHGEGSFEWVDGERFEGSYVDGSREGYGTYFWPSGDRYEGQWKGDRRNGQGTLFDMDGNVRYKGLWKDDKPVE